MGRQGPSLTQKVLLPTLLLLALAGLALVTFANRRIEAQKETMAKDAAEASLRLFTETLEFAMAQGAQDFDPLFSRLSGIGRLSQPRVVAAPALGVKRPHAPDDWESEVLRTGLRRSGRVGSDRSRAYRVVIPVVANESCRSCHAVRAGDIVAAVGASVSTAEWDASASALQRDILLVGLLTGLLLMTLTYGILRHLVARPLAAAGGFASALAEGDLTHRVATGASDEVGRLAECLNEMADSLHGLLAGVRSTAEKVAEGSRRLADSAAALSTEVEVQATHIADAASAIEELTASVSDNAGNADRVNRLAHRAADDATASSAGVTTTAQALARIADQTSDVDGIARQTHLLALNATIEASHAGDFGKGFAVVATEVRKLAERSRSTAR